MERLKSCVSQSLEDFCGESILSWCFATVHLLYCSLDLVFSRGKVKVAGRTESPTKKCWTELDQQALSRCCWSLRCAGQAMSSEWRRTAYPDRSCMESLKMVRANKDAQNWDTKTLWRATSNGAVFSHVSSKRVPPTDQDGGPSTTRQPLPLMKIGDSVSLQQGTNVTGQRPPWSKIQTVSVQPVGAYVLPASDCGATCVVIAECIANVIIGSRWTTKKESTHHCLPRYILWKVTKFHSNSSVGCEDTILLS